MELNSFIVVESDSVLHVMERINKNARGIAFVCEQGLLKGVVSDGDIRRYILSGGDLSEPVGRIANHEPHYLYQGQSVNEKVYMKEYSITALPIVNRRKRLLSIQFLDDTKVFKDTNLQVPVAIMAGGKGTRLYPYTQVIPKPLIPVGDQTITEHIMDRFEAFGCDCFDIIVNYKKNIIKAFFTDESVEEHTATKRKISFLEETDYLGTGGGLRLLIGRYSGTFFMSNCDILVDEDYSEIVKYHKKEGNLITMVSAMKKLTIPYGTIEIREDGSVSRLTEKPDYSFMTNTGLYVIEPAFLERIPADTFIHITDVIQNCIEAGDKVGVYPISEYAWMDMGQVSELERMRERLGGIGDV